MHRIGQVPDMSVNTALAILLLHVQFASVTEMPKARQVVDPVGCYQFDRPLGHSAPGNIEASDSTWYTVRLLPNGAVARPDLVSAYWRELYANRSGWSLARDTLRVRVLDGLVGWDLVLMPRDSGYTGVARYLSDVIGGPPFKTVVHAQRKSCPAAGPRTTP